MKLFRLWGVWSRLKRRGGALMKISRALRVFIPMSRDVLSGRYRPVPWAAFFWMLASLSYLVLPFDLIPDVLLLLGLVDDVFIVGWLLTRVDNALTDYRRWKGIDTPPEVEDGT
ncbi:YkvA family protein [Halomonas sp. WWR20]